MKTMAVCDENTTKEEFLIALQNDLDKNYVEVDNMKLITILQKPCGDKKEKSFMDALNQIEPITYLTNRSVNIMRTKYENLKERPRKIDHLLLTVRRA